MLLVELINYQCQNIEQERANLQNGGVSSHKE